MTSTFVLRHAVFALLVSCVWAFDASSQTNVALYWGQNSAGSQESLATYCQSDAADIYLLSFMTSFSNADTLPTLNFANACTSKFSDGLLDCDQIAEDIQTCQGLGKKVFLSLGGATGSYGFSSDSDAEGFATTLWNMFGGGSADERPFGDAIIDGFDFDIESGESTGYAALATKLREYYSQDSSKDYYISAAPQCVYPDSYTGDMLANADIDFAFIQFYNNNCDVDKQFNWDTWADFAQNTSPNKNIKLYLGLPGASSAASYGYVDVDTVKSALESLDATNLGGIMLWDASQGFSNEVDGKTYVEAMKDLLEETFSSISASSESSSTVSSSSAYSSASSTEASTVSSTEASSSTAESSTSATSSTESSTVSSSSATAASSTESVAASEAASSSIEATTSSTSSTSSTSTALSSTSSSSTATPQAPAVVSEQPAPTVVSEPTSTPVAASVPTPTSAASEPTQQAPEVTSSTSSTQTVPTFTATTLSTLTVGSSTSTSSTATASASAAFTDCSALSGKDKAACLNKNFDSGLYTGSADSCSIEGETACSSDGSFAICNFGKWVKMQCAAGTTCFAYVQNSDVDIGCNYQSQKSSFTKRDGYLDIFKRSPAHVHHGHN
ncbi:hypothetical protein OGAPHI_005887 [Ogataea philodendri]|uniref:chitinase n=1 Tax=Ogataea philodendri TaxID=1378263 RepID=A0A9P8P020_9ASCO|nr:uncharacterized protein OGAPHI_005887 [Ogataea philodendri]KAH3662635.1 hypothetical protein OGAPHI_005887 [Ogataea philodendri]